MNTQPTLNDILQAVNGIDRKFDRIEENTKRGFEITHARIDDLQSTVDTIIETLQVFSTDVDQKFAGVDQRFSNVDQRFDMIDTRFKGIDQRFDRLEGRLDGVEGKIAGVEGKIDGLDGRLGHVESAMVTKDYLDDKLADLRGDLVVLARKENAKLSSFVEELVERKSLTRSAADRILALEPFPQR